MTATVPPLDLNRAEEARGGGGGSTAAGKSPSPHAEATIIRDDDEDDSAEESSSPRPPRAVCVKASSNAMRGTLVVRSSETIATSRTSIPGETPRDGTGRGREADPTKAKRPSARPNDPNPNPVRARREKADELSASKLKHVAPLRKQRPDPPPWHNPSSKKYYSLEPKHADKRRLAAHADAGYASCCCAHERESTEASARALVDAEKAKTGEIRAAMAALELEHATAVATAERARQTRIAKKAAANRTRNALTRSLRRWREAAEERVRERRLTTRAVTHEYYRVARKHLHEFRASVATRRKIRHGEARSVKHWRRRVVGAHYRAWFTLVSEDAYQSAAAAASHATIVASRVTRKYYALKGRADALTPAFRGWHQCVRTYKGARAALESVGEGIRNETFFLAAVFSRWREGSIAVRRAKVAESARCTVRLATEVAEREASHERTVERMLARETTRMRDEVRVRSNKHA
jgi:hypothetical protein